ncbi:MAG TPA: hypothetical protein VNZ63_08975 [Verrucomicrobiae bacterium]|jgi:hypothetical protein|nr:hypothetical protein [Verrucomicrobiae bacterium]
MRMACRIALLAVLAGATVCAIAAHPPAFPQAATQQSAPSSAAQSPSAPKPATTKPVAKPVPAAMTNRDVIALVKAKISDDIIITKIKQSKTRFDTSTDGLVALKQTGVSDQLIAVMVDAGSSSDAAPSGATAPAAAASAATAASSTKAKNRPVLKPGETPANAKGEAAATDAGATPRTASDPAPRIIATAPPNYGLYIESTGELKPLGRIETKVQVSKFRSFLRSHIPFVRQKIDIDLPGAHSTSRFELRRPLFYAYFPPSRDVSKFKLLQCKITGQNFDQRTVANASIMFSTEQNQDEVPVDIGPTSVKDLYRIAPREDLTSGEFGFIEGNTGSQSASDIEILDVYDFGIDRKEEKVSLVEYLDTLPPASVPDQAFLSWSKEDAQKIVDDREGKTGIVGSMFGWFKRQYASLDVYWADPQFARGFARLQMLDRNLTPEQTNKLCNLLLSQADNKYFIMVSIGGKVGSGHLIGANEGERLMRPFDASLTNNKSKDVVPAKKLVFIGGYADVWKVEFDQQGIRGPLMEGDAKQLVFEARLNQNLEFKATFPLEKINPSQAGPAPAGAASAGEAAEPAKNGNGKR